MKAPLSWLKDYVEIDLPIGELAHLITMAGMEVEEIQIIGLPMPAKGTVDCKVTGLAWDREKIVVASISEVMPHPNADRLTLCKLFDGEREHIVLTGAPNLFEFKGKGPLPKPLMVAYAKEGAQIYDGHAEGLVLTTLKPAKIRGVDSYSMVCSEKELGISEEHEGIMLLEDGAETRHAAGGCAGRRHSGSEFAAQLRPLRQHGWVWRARSPPSPTNLSNWPHRSTCPVKARTDFVELEITEPANNPRFMAGSDPKMSTIAPQPRAHPAPIQGWSGCARSTTSWTPPITPCWNWAQPLHAFDYDVLVKRAKGKKCQDHHPQRQTRRNHSPRWTAWSASWTPPPPWCAILPGALSIAGVMGGAESEVTPKQRPILLESASWNMINIRKTARGQNLPSEASYRYCRGVHPAMAQRGLFLALDLMAQWTGGKVAAQVADSYPLPPEQVVVELTAKDVKRWLGISIATAKIAELLRRLELQVTVDGDRIKVKIPDHRMDIEEGIAGKASVIEEVARIYGYGNIPEVRMADSLPPQKGNPSLVAEERVRDLLVSLGAQEVISYRWSTPEREKRRLSPDSEPYTMPYREITESAARERLFAPECAGERAGYFRAQFARARAFGLLRDRTHLFGWRGRRTAG